MAIVREVSELVVFSLRKGYLVGGSCPSARAGGIFPRPSQPPYQLSARVRRADCSQAAQNSGPQKLLPEAARPQTETWL